MSAATEPHNSVATHCPFCALQCGLTLTLDEDDRPVVAARDFPTNKGGLCRKGWTAAQLLETPDRLTSPLLRDPEDGALKPCSWDAALDYTVAKLQSLRNAHGNDAVSVFGGGALTNEKAYALGKFTRVALKSRYIDYNGRFCMAAGAAASQLAFGIDRGLPFPLEDIPKADIVLIAGANPAATMPPIMQYFTEQQSRGGRLIVADPRRTATADTADLHLQPVPGTDLALFNGLLHILIRDKLIDVDFIAQHTNDFALAQRTAQHFWPDRVERITGIPEATLEQTAQWLGAANSVIALSGRGIEQQTTGVDNDLGLINLVLALGMAGKPGCGYGCLTGQGNGQGGREHGQKADQLPGYRKLDDPAARQWIASIWNVQADALPPPGVSACEMFDLFGEQIHALLVFASNPAVSAPNAKRMRSQLAKLDLLVVCDAFLSDTAALADVVLPVTQWAEESGTTTNLEGRVLLRQPLRPPPEGVRSDLDVIAALASRLGCSAGFSSEPNIVFNELRRASAGGIADYSGISYARLKAEQGVFWPCRDEAPAGAPRLFADGFATEDRRANFFAVDFRDAAETPDQDYPLFLTTGRLLSQYQTGVQTRRIAELAEAEPQPLVEMHPQMAKTYGIADGDRVRVTTRHGAVVLHARLLQGIRLDTIFMPFHWGGQHSANQLTGTALDPKSKIPAFKLSVGRIEPWPQSEEVVADVATKIGKGL